MTLPTIEPQYGDTQQSDRNTAKKNVTQIRQRLGDRIPDPHLERLYKFPKIQFDQPFIQQSMPTAGIPDSWDYKTATRGPNNEELPAGATGWDKYGEPYFGGDNPFQEWLNPNRMRQSIWGNVASESLTELRAQRHEFNVAAGEALTQGKFGQAFLNTISSIGMTLGEILPKKIIGEDSTELIQGGEVQKGGWLAAGSRAVGEVITGLGVTIDALTSRPVKQAMSVVEGRKELLGEQAYTGIGEKIGGSIRERFDTMPDSLLKSAGNWVAGAFENITPVEWFVNAVKVGQVVDRETLYNADKMNWNAGRIMYSSFIDPAVREEYKRRYLDGENPYLLEQELMNPFAEAVGEIIFDPLNILTAGNKGKKLAATAEKVTKEFATTADDLVDAASVLQKSNKIEDLEHLATALEKTNLRLAGTTGDTRRGALALTQVGAQNRMQRTAAHFVSQDLMHVQGNPDKFYQVAKARAALASPDLAQRTKAIQYLISEGIPINNFLSEGSLRFSSILHQMYFDEAGQLDRKFLDGMLNIMKYADDEGNIADVGKFVSKEAATFLRKEAGDNPIPAVDAIQTYFSERYTKAVEKVFPTYSENVSPIKNTLQKIAQREGKVGGALGWVNSKGATLWMKWSPGFASRNWISNKFHILSDQGVRGLVQSFRKQDNVSTVGKIFGNDVPSFLKQGYGAGGKFTEVAEAGERVKFFDWIGNNLKRSGIYEANARLSASSYSLKQSWKVGKRAVLDGTILREAGLGEDLVRQVQNVLDLEYGNWNAAAPAIKELLSGEADYIKTFQWLDDQNKTWMRNYDVLDQLTDGLRGATSREEALKIVDDIEARIKELADTTGSELIIPDMEDVTGAGQQLAKDMEKYSKFVSNDGQVALFGQHKMATLNAEQAMGQTVSGFYYGSIAELRKVGVSQADATRLVDELISTNDDWVKIRNIKYVKEVVDEQAEIAETAWSWVRALREPGAGQETVTQALDVYRSLGMEVNIPTNAHPLEIARYLVEDVWWPYQRKAFAVARDGMAVNTATLTAALNGLVIERGGQIADNARQLYKNMFVDWQNSKMLDYALSDKVGGTWKPILLTEASGENYQSVVKLAAENGVFTATLDASGNVKPNNKHLLSVIKKYTGKEYKNIYDIPMDVAEQAFENRRLGKEFVGEIEKIAAGAGETIEGVAAVYDKGGATISNGVPYQVAQPELTKRFQQLRDTINQNWGRKVETVGGDYAEALDAYKAQVNSRMYDWRSVATQTAKELGDFMLHDYGDQRNIDLVLGLIYPYQFWYSRTYANWLKRVVSNPAIASRYYRYKNAMAKIHAGLPDYYKYQINTNELFGLDSEHPLMFNLEAVINPLNGVTGVDFDDPAKRVNWWTKMLDGLGRFGPSINPILQYGTAIALMAQGEEEAASHWAGRLVTATSTIQSLGAMTGLDWLATHDLDPSVAIFSKGTDPWLRNRTGRALAQMQQEGWNGYTPEAMFEAARIQSGPIWDEARIRAIQDRGWGQLASYFFGVGFKPLTQNDMQIDQMYQELYGTLSMKDALDPIEYKQQMQELNRRYPFMDTVLTSKKAGAARDTAYSWSILGRIPPGDSRTIYEMVGLDGDLVDKFYDDKGDMTQWTESDRDRFMASMVDMAAVLAMPDGMTQQKWDFAKLQYTAMTTQLEQRFGDDIFDRIDGYYAIKDTKGEDAAYAYLDANPVISLAMSMKDAIIVNGPEELRAYYSSLSTIQRYYKSKMWGEAEVRFGADIFDISGGYGLLFDSDEKKAYKQQYPQLEEYWNFLDTYSPIINQHIINTYNMLPKTSITNLRKDFLPEGASIGASELYESLQQPQDEFLTYTPQQWVNVIGQNAFEIAIQASRRPLEYKESQVLDKAAGKLDISRDRLVQYVGISMYNPLQ